jgi:general secretion pathway protein I
VSSRGFTLVEVMVALMIVAIGLAALMTAVSGAARTSGYLRDKTLAQWIALNRLSEVRLTVNKLGENGDKGEVDFANRTWHYDTRYFDTTISGMKRVVVRVWAGDAKTKGNPVAESTGFLGASVGTPGGSNVADWTTGTTPSAAPCAPTANGTNPTNPTNTTAGPNGSNVPCTPTTTNGTVGATPTGSATTVTPGPVPPTPLQ